MKQTDDESLALSLVRDDLPFRLQRRVGLIPEQGLGTMRRGQYFLLCSPGCPSSFGPCLRAGYCPVPWTSLY